MKAGLINELVPSLATERDDFFVGFEDAVRQPVVAHELPDVLHRVQLGCSGRQGQQRDVGGNVEPGGRVPSGAVEDEDGMGVWRDL